MPDELTTTAPVAIPLGGESAAAGGERDVTTGWVSPLVRLNADPVLAGRDLRIYEELLRDSSVSIAFNQRRLALLGKPVEVVDGADDPRSKAAAEDMRRQLQGISWDTITGAMLTGRIIGYGVGECMFRRGGAGVELADIKVRKARRFLFSPDGDLRLRTRAAPYGEPLPANKFWVFSSPEDVTDDPYGFGLGQILYWLVWFKRNDVKLWFQALDKYAAPTTVGKYAPGTPEDQINRLLGTLSSVRNSSAIAVPNTFDVDLLKATASGAGDYSAAYEMLDEAITMVIAGQTMTSRDGSSKSQGEVHERVLDAIVKADDDLISDSFNRGPATWLTGWNFPGAVPPRVRRDTDPPENLKAAADIDTLIANMGFEPDEAYIQQRYGAHWKRRPGGVFGFGGPMAEADAIDAQP